MDQQTEPARITPRRVWTVAAIAAAGVLGAGCQSNDPAGSLLTIPSSSVTTVVLEASATAIEGDEASSAVSTPDPPETTTTMSDSTAESMSESSESSELSESTNSSGSATDTAGAVTPDEALFTSVQATVNSPATATEPADSCELCVWVAQTQDQQEQGLMAVTDLGGRDAMAFVYAEPHTTQFWMKDTVMPLSIAFFDAAGVYMDSFDMDPCTTEQCVTYPTPEGFTVALEVPQGGLADLAIVPGSTLTMTDIPCTSAARKSSDA